MIFTAAVSRSIPNAAFPSNRTSDVFVFPAFSSNDANDTGPAYRRPNAWLSTTVGFAMFVQQLTIETESDAERSRH